MSPNLQSDNMSQDDDALVAEVLQHVDGTLADVSRKIYDLLVSDTINLSEDDIRELLGEGAPAPAVSNNKTQPMMMIEEEEAHAEEEEEDDYDEEPDEPEAAPEPVVTTKTIPVLQQVDEKQPSVVSTEDGSPASSPHNHVDNSPMFTEDTLLESHWSSPSRDIPLPAALPTVISDNDDNKSVSTMASVVTTATARELKTRVSALEDTLRAFTQHMKELSRHLEPTPTPSVIHHAQEASTSESPLVAAESLVEAILNLDEAPVESADDQVPIVDEEAVAEEDVDAVSVLSADSNVSIPEIKADVELPASEAVPEETPTVPVDQTLNASPEPEIAKAAAVVASDEELEGREPEAPLPPTPAPIEKMLEASTVPDKEETAHKTEPTPESELAITWSRTVVSKATPELAQPVQAVVTPQAKEDPTETSFYDGVLFEPTALKASPPSDVTNASALAQLQQEKLALEQTTRALQDQLTAMCELLVREGLTVPTQPGLEDIMSQVQSRAAAKDRRINVKEENPVVRTKLFSRITLVIILAATLLAFLTSIDFRNPLLVGKDTAVDVLPPVLPDEPFTCDSAAWDFEHDVPGPVLCPPSEPVANPSEPAESPLEPVEAVEDVEARHPRLRKLRKFIGRKARSLWGKYKDAKVHAQDVEEVSRSWVWN